MRKISDTSLLENKTYSNKMPSLGKLSIDERMRAPSISKLDSAKIIS